MDYYLEDKTRLANQPKRTIGDYVESEGILVPKRFNSFQEAWNWRTRYEFMARSEHPLDYDGASGIIPSMNIYNVAIYGIKKEEDVYKSILGSNRAIARIVELANLLNLKPKKFISGISFSYWEKINGFNRAIVADSAVENKYHIMTKDNSEFVNYSIYEKGSLKSLGSEMKDKEKDAKELVAFYERIRNLPRFDKNHCPIIEVQTTPEGKNYFLQSHRTVDFRPADFFLERQTEKGEVESWFVRGATPKEGINMKTLISRKKLIPIPEEAESFSQFVGINPIFEEIMTRKVGAILGGNPSFEPYLWGAAQGHSNRSVIFKPKIFGIFKNKIYTYEEFNFFEDLAEKTGENQYLNLHLISDGRRALIKRLD